MAKTQFTRAEGSLLALLSGVYFCLMVDFMVLMPLGPQLMRLLGIGAGQFSWVVSSYTLAAGLSGLLGSRIVDRFDRKRVLTLMFAGFTVGNLACGFAPNYPLLIAARCFTGFFSGIVGSSVYSILSDRIPIEKRATAIGVVMSSFAGAAILGLPVCLKLADHFGWQSPFFFLVVVGLGMHFLLRYLPSVRGHLESQETVNRMDLLQPIPILFLITLILGHFSVIPFLFPTIVANAGIPENHLAGVYLAGGIASIIASVACGKIADRVGNRQVFALALLVSVGPLWWATRMGPSSIWFVILVTSSFYIVMSGRMAPAMALLSATVRPEMRGGFMSLLGSVQQLSAAAGAWLAGQLVTRTEEGKLVGFQNVGLVAIGFSLAALVLSRKIRTLEGK